MGSRAYISPPAARLVLTFLARFLWQKVGPDRVRVFKWTGKNDYVALCEPDYISFGGG